MTRINLLPPEERAKAAREQGLALLILGLVILVVVLGALYFMQYQQVSSKQQQVSDLDSQIAQVQQQVAALAPFQTMQTQRTSEFETALQIYQARVTWSSILEEISLIIPDNCDLTALNATVPPPMLAGSSFGGSATTAAADTITLAGQAWTHNDVADFMTRLALLPQIYGIKLINSSGGPSTTGARAMVTFEIHASLRPFITPPPGAVPAVGGAQ